jgi:argininosuccinate lyase
MFDMNKLATDLITFSMKELAFLHLPESFCTGSSIMPQKKNPDVLELARGNYHLVLGQELAAKSLIANLMSGFNRDMQLLKEPMFSAVENTKRTLDIMTLVVANIEVDEDNCRKAMTDELYATEEAYKLVQAGTPFRDAYREVAKKFAARKPKKR